MSAEITEVKVTGSVESADFQSFAIRIGDDGHIDTVFGTYNYINKAGNLDQATIKITLTAQNKTDIEAILLSSKVKSDAKKDLEKSAGL